MRIESSFRGFILSSSLAGALALLAGCGQQAPAEEDLALAGTSQALTQEQVLPTGGVCSPTGAHGKHVHGELRRPATTAAACSSSARPARRWPPASRSRPSTR